jgi:hypothetical protein
MPRPRLKGKKYVKRDTVRCVWCFEPFETNHSNAQTCSGKCRSRLAFFRKVTGFDPDEPPGNVTAHTAYLDLVAKLLAAERVRRQHRSLVQSVPYHKRHELERQLDSELAEKRRKLNLG